MTELIQEKFLKDSVGLFNATMYEAGEGKFRPLDVVDGELVIQVEPKGRQRLLRGEVIEQLKRDNQREGIYGAYVVKKGRPRRDEY